MKKLVCLLGSLALLTPAFAQGTAFTYQGRLNVSGAPANGIYDFQFALFNTNSAGSLYAGPVTNASVTVSNGLFTTAVDFGPGVFVGASNWLGIAVSTNAANTFTTLSPRQQLTPTPYAIYSTAAGGVNGLVIQQNSSGAPNMIGGSSVNYVSSGVVGATIAGGGTTNYLGFSHTNSVTADFGTVSGGYNNTANGVYATVSGGNFNTAGNNYATVSGGSFNTANGNTATVGGGEGNTASGVYANIAGGFGNQASGIGSFIGGGGYDGTLLAGNMASGAASAIVGGLANTNQADYSAIGGGRGNQIKAGAEYSAIASGVNNQVSGIGSFIGGGGYNGSAFGGNTNGGNSSVIGGGIVNTIQAGSINSTIGGGAVNTIWPHANNSTIGGGAVNTIWSNASASIISGGAYNTDTGSYATIPGGDQNVAS